MPVIMPIYGTRPEVIKMAPIIAELEQTPAWSALLPPPSFDTPVLVIRDSTERPAVVKAGAVNLFSANEDRIVSEADRLLT